MLGQRGEAVTVGGPLIDGEVIVQCGWPFYLDLLRKGPRVKSNAILCAFIGPVPSSVHEAASFRVGSSIFQLSRQSYPGEHEAIIDRKLWDGVHDICRGGAPKACNADTGSDPALLKGLLFGAQEAMR